MKHFVYILVFLGISLGLFAQTSTQNYIVTTVPFSEVSSPDALTDANSNTTIQYFDGLGRLSQTVQKAVTPSGADLVTGVTYDAFGRQSQQWLPAVAQGNNGAYVPDYQSKATSYSAYSEGNPYAQTNYEPSPLNRVTEQYGPGADWQSKGKSQKTAYITNGASDVKYFYVENDVLKCNNYYAAATLYGITSTDEDGKTVTEYTDKQGRKILSRAAGNFDTYYVYDDFDNRRYVLPPAASDALGNNSSGFPETKGSTLDLYGYIYKYDGRKRNIVKKLPGCDSICMVYDKADRLIASQDGNQRTKNQWIINKYDVFGRLLYTGIFPGGGTRVAIAATFSNLVLNEIYTGSGSMGGYNCSGIQPSTLLTVNYYDNYTFLKLLSPEQQTQLAPQNMNGYTPPDTVHTKTMLTGTQVYHLNDPTKYETTAIYYDKYGHVVQTRATNHMSGYDMAYNQVDFLGKPLRTYKTQTGVFQTNFITELYTYSYDKAQRLTKTTHQLNDGATVTLSENTYDDLGRLQTKKVGNGIETTTYAYNIRNWLTGITSSRFTENLYYNAPYTTGVSINSLYNGNISAMKWSIPGDNIGNDRIYAFSYDGLNRLTSSGYGEWKSGMPQSASGRNYAESFMYDKQGNIIQLSRNGLQYNYATPTYTTVDNLYISYNGNQLTKVSDTGMKGIYTGNEGYSSVIDQNSNCRQYDANGNAIYDINNNVLGIRYNVLNLPDTIQFYQGHQTAYTYSAIGTKLNVVDRTAPAGINLPITNIGMIVKNPSMQSLMVTNYIDNKIYELTVLKKILLPEGYYDNTKQKYVYFLKDHLGSVRAVLQEDGQILERNHYYPSGMRFGESALAGSVQPYRHGGFEMQAMHGLNYVDNLARFRLVNIPGTTTMDQHCEKYYSWSPYSMYFDNPMRYTDYDGKDITVYYIMGYDTQGNEKWATWTFNGTNQSAAPTNQYVQDFLTAYTYDVENGVKAGNGGGASLYELANSKDMHSQVVDAITNEQDGNIVYWNSQYATTTKEGYVYSPATTLEHEMTHELNYQKNPEAQKARRDTYDKQYENKEERKVITGAEAKTAQANGEFPKGYVRSDHNGYNRFKVSDPTKTTPAPPQPPQQQTPSPSLWERFKQWWNNF